MARHLGNAKTGQANERPTHGPPTQAGDRRPNAANRHTGTGATGVRLANSGLEHTRLANAAATGTENRNRPADPIPNRARTGIPLPPAAPGPTPPPKRRNNRLDKG